MRRPPRIVNYPIAPPPRPRYKQDMVNWRPHLKPEEAARLIAIKAEKAGLSIEARRIIDRARKRAIRA